MALRTSGLIALLAGAAVAMISAYAVSETASMAENLAIAARMRGVAFDVADWTGRWRVASLVSGVAGLAIVGGGALLFFRRRWGLLVISAVLIVIGALPWLLESVGATRYEFENPSVIETLVLFLLAAGAAVAHFRPRHHVDA